MAHLLVAPLLLQHQLVVVVGQNGRAESPWAVEATAVGVAAPQRMGTRQGHNLTIVEAHTPKNGAKMRLLLGSIREAAVRRAHAHVAIGSTRTPGNDRALHFLQSSNARQRPEIGIADPGELLCKRSAQARPRNRSRAETDL